MPDHPVPCSYIKVFVVIVTIKLLTIKGDMEFLHKNHLAATKRTNIRGNRVNASRLRAIAAI